LFLKAVQDEVSDGSEMVGIGYCCRLVVLLPVIVCLFCIHIFRVFLLNIAKATTIHTTCWRNSTQNDKTNKLNGSNRKVAPKGKGTKKSATLRDGEMVELASKTHK